MTASNTKDAGETGEVEKTTIPPTRVISKVDQVACCHSLQINPLEPGGSKCSIASIWGFLVDNSSLLISFLLLLLIL